MNWLPLALLGPVWLGSGLPAAPTAVSEFHEQILLGTKRGLYCSAGEGWRLLLTRGGVRDLAAGPEGMLLAMGAGLYDWPLGASAPRARALGAGARVSSVAIDSRGRSWVGSEVGLFMRPREGERFRRDSSIPAGPVAAVRAAGNEVWVATRGTLWLARGDSEFVPRLRQLRSGWWELNGAVHLASDTVLSVPRGLWRIKPEAVGESRIEPGVGELHAMVLAHGKLWLASDRGVHGVVPEALEAAAPDPVLARETLALLDGSQGLLAATPGGIAWLAFPLAEAQAIEASALTIPMALESWPAEGPDIRRLQRAVLAYLELSPHRIADLDSRARRTAFLPQLKANLSLDRDRGKDRRHDQSFSSGALHDLFDRTHDRRVRHGFDLQLVWDLSRLTDPRDAIAISKERRELIELRDQVLERVNRLYFERLRALERLTALHQSDGPERHKTEIRVRELAAQLDAWSGGMFSRLAGSRPGGRSFP